MKNLFQRLLFRRLCSEAPADGGEGGGGGGGGTQTDPGVGKPSENPPADPPSDGPASEKPHDPPADPNKPTPPKEETPPGAPEKYAFTAPEGQELDTSALAQFEPVARELNLTQEQAQKLVDVYPKVLAGVQQQQAESWQKQTEDWAATVKADKDIGGDKLASNLGAAQRAIDTFGTKELKEYLDGTGLGNHPELVKFCIKVGKGMAEDQIITGNKTGGDLDLVSAFYPKK